MTVCGFGTLRETQAKSGADFRSPVSIRQAISNSPIPAIDLAGKFSGENNGQPHCPVVSCAKASPVCLSGAHRAG
jgi:hypothetical protein